MLSEVLPIRSGMVVALVGAGGKTTTMFRLAAELAALGQRVITTTTTHIYPPDAAQTEALVLAPVPPASRRLFGVGAPTRALLLECARDALASHTHITVALEAATEGKLRGLPPEWVADLRDLPGVAGVLVEADGAKKCIIKAPAAYEPVIPACTDLVLLLASASALGQPLSETIAHRVEQITAVTGLAPGDIITPHALSTLATSHDGLLKGRPAGAAAILVLTHIEKQQLEQARATAKLSLASERLAGVLLCSLEWAEYLPYAL